MNCPAGAGGAWCAEKELNTADWVRLRLWMKAGRRTRQRRPLFQKLPLPYTCGNSNLSKAASGPWRRFKPLFACLKSSRVMHHTPKKPRSVQSCLHSESTWHTGWQTPRSSIAIVRISYIRCAVRVKKHNCTCISHETNLSLMLRTPTEVKPTRSFRYIECLLTVNSSWPDICVTADNRLPPLSLPTPFPGPDYPIDTVGTVPWPTKIGWPTKNINKFFMEKNTFLQNKTSLCSQ